MMRVTETLLTQIASEPAARPGKADESFAAAFAQAAEREPAIDAEPDRTGGDALERDERDDERDATPPAAAAGAVTVIPEPSLGWPALPATAVAATSTPAPTSTLAPTGAHPAGLDGPPAGTGEPSRATAAAAPDAFPPTVSAPGDTPSASPATSPPIEAAAPAASGPADQAKPAPSPHRAPNPPPIAAEPAPPSPPGDAPSSLALAGSASTAVVTIAASELGGEQAGEDRPGAEPDASAAIPTGAPVADLPASFAIKPSNADPAPPTPAARGADDLDPSAALGNHARIVVGDGDQRVVVSVAVRGGAVDVALRTDDPALAADLRGSLDELNRSLRDHGLSMGGGGHQRPPPPPPRHHAATAAAASLDFDPDPGAPRDPRVRALA